MKTVLFVCTGNTCRSPMAVALMEDMIARDDALAGKIKAISAGILASDGSEISEFASAALKEKGIENFKHGSRPLTQEIVDKADIILTMDAHNMQILLASFPQAKEKTHALKGYSLGYDGFPGDDYDIDDPYGAPQEIYSLVADELQLCIKSVLERFAAEDFAD